MIGVYIHFPWCLRKCPYCDFTSYATRQDDVPHEAFAGAVIRELERRLLAGDWTGSKLTVFVGGGTPSLWRPEALGRVLARLRELGELVEVTVECNPSSLDADGATRLAAAGVGRLSVGVQSLEARHLAFLGRLHDGPGALGALVAARAAALRVSADLIAGMPGQTPAELERDIDAVVEAGVEHLSVYTLTIEPGTPFGDLQRRRLLAAPSDDHLADLYEAARAALASRGFEHYEVSNWGRHCLHNRVYWEGGQYLGLGPGAFGFHRTTGGGVRYRNTLDPARYLSPSPPDDWRENLSAADLVNEGVLLGLRLREGIDLAALGARHGLDAIAPRARAVERLCREGLLEREGTRLRIPEERWLLADRVIRELFVIGQGSNRGP
ncbi:MAG: radical SAM family heme chaperone HemW [Deltaproteobacteria bacterium]|nr:radical SAM family heme chaperone HemW [Deltaproteobacteria bacterium]